MSAKANTYGLLSWIREGNHKINTDIIRIVTGGVRMGTAYVFQKFCSSTKIKSLKNNVTINPANKAQRLCSGH